MRWFRRRREYALAPLIDPPIEGEPITLDKEEKEIFDQIPSGSLGQGMQLLDQSGIITLAEPIKGELEDMVLVEALMRLMDLARSRLGAGDHRGAAQTCVKILAIGNSFNFHIFNGKREVWFLLAEIYAEYDDMQRFRFCLQAAKEHFNEEIERIRQQDNEDEEFGRAFEDEWNAKIADLQRRFS